MTASAARLLGAAVLVAMPAACGGAASGREHSLLREHTVVLTVRHSRFVPSAVEVPNGTRVRFVVHNTDPIPHELIVGDQATQDAHETGSEEHHGDAPGEVSVAAGGTASTSYVFDRGGRVLFGCHLPGHWAYGMQGVVLVG
jgi:uncharacterized cupredoxin-like copper-binding protein